MDLERDLGSLIDKCCERARALANSLSRAKKLADVGLILRNVHTLRNFDLKTQDPSVTDEFAAKVGASFPPLSVVSIHSKRSIATFPIGSRSVVLTQRIIFNRFLSCAIIYLRGTVRSSRGHSMRSP